MARKKAKYNLLFLDDAFLSIETGLMSAVYLWIEEVYGKYINIYHAKDISEAFKKLDKINKLDILITDMNLPYYGIPPLLIEKYQSGKFGGIYFIDEILKINPNARIMVSSGWDYDEYKHMLDERVKITLSKPYGIPLLEESLDTLIQEVIGIDTNIEWKKKYKINNK